MTLILPENDDAWTGEFRSARERFLSAEPGSADHDLYPMFRAASQIRDPELREVLLSGSERLVDRALNWEWGTDLGGSLRKGWEVWSVASHRLSEATKRSKNVPVNRWDPADPADGGPLLSCLMLSLMAGAHMRTGGSWIPIRYHKAEWTPAAEARRGGILLANLFIQTPWGGPPDLVSQKENRFALRSSYRRTSWSLVLASDSDEVLGVRVCPYLTQAGWHPYPPSWMVWGPPDARGEVWAALRRSRSGFNPPGWDAAARLQLALQAGGQGEFHPALIRGWEEEELRRPRRFGTLI